MVALKDWVGKALVEAFRNIYREIDENLCCELEEFTYGWAALPACSDQISRHIGAVENATTLGSVMAEHRVAAAKAALRRKLKAEEERRKLQEAETAATTQQQELPAEPAPDHGVVVARLSAEEMKNVKLKDILGPLKSVINIALPLVEAPPLHDARNALLFEFPYAADAIDFVLADLVGRTTVYLRPLLLEELGMVAALDALARQFAERTGIGVKVVADERVRARDAVPDAIAICLYRVAQEALNNVAKHAGARRVELSVGMPAEGGWRLEVSDDGRGMQPADRLKPMSLGLRGMAERVRALGGTFDVDGAAGRGVRLVVAIPADAAQDRAAPQ